MIPDYIPAQPLYTSLALKLAYNLDKNTGGENKGKYPLSEQLGTQLLEYLKQKSGYFSQK